jgi:hypothetical protein
VKRFVLIALFFWTLLSWTAISVASNSQVPVTLLPVTLLDVAESNLRYIASEQREETDSIYWAGEWPTHLYSTLLPAMLGVGTLIGHDQEATDFTTASVVSQLAVIYLDYPELKGRTGYEQIPDSLERAALTFKRYQVGSLFNFYPPRAWRGRVVHQPADMTLLGLWRGFTNIPPDADTSSNVFAALLLTSRIHGGNYQIPLAALNSFSEFRDLQRRPHFYNRREHQVQTGAFMTWLRDEKDPSLPHFYFAPPERGVRIPFNRNDVDCIVNLNILKMLALQNQSEVPGHAEACAMISEIISKNQLATCGIYYPNTFNLGFSMAQAENAGETCFSAPTKNAMVEDILKLQSADGGWDNDRNTWQDRVQSTAFAMISLFEFADLNDFRVQSSLRYGTIYLLRQLKKSEQGSFYWPGEVLFTATAIARSLVVWKSNSYTTAVAAQALLKMHRHFPKFNPSLAFYNSAFASHSP